MYNDISTRLNNKKTYNAVFSINYRQLLIYYILIIIFN